MKSFRIRSLFALLAASVVATGILAVEPADAAKRTAKSAKADKKAAKAAKSESGHRTYAQYEKDATVYWQSVVDMRRVRIAKRNRGEAIELTDYVLTQPPHWPGALPRRPLPPATPGVPRLPLVSHMLTMAAEQHGFVPQRPASDLDFKRAYAAAATAAGITGQQAVRIYAFETGGNGTYDVQAGLTHPSKKARAISSAIGYNQLLTANSVGLMAAHGDRFLEKLQAKAETLTGAERAAMDKKIAATKKMIAFCRSVPYQWSEHEKLVQTKRAGVGMHAALFDIDLGPLMQSQKLAELHGLRQEQGPRAAADRSRARDDELHGRRQRHRPRHHVGRDAAAGADLELLPASRLRAQPDRAPHRRGVGALRVDEREDGPRLATAGCGRARSRIRGGG